jgi:predicted GIY-YIG superfamily endonuclease
MENRLAKHTSGTGAKYTKGRAPYKIMYKEESHTKNSALKREAFIKTLRREQKLDLITASCNSFAVN